MMSWTNIALLRRLQNKKIHGMDAGWPSMAQALRHLNSPPGSLRFKYFPSQLLLALPASFSGACDFLRM